jgi:hypothetical protein
MATTAQKFHFPKTIVRLDELSFKETKKVLELESNSQGKIIKLKLGIEEIELDSSQLLKAVHLMTKV